MKQITLMLVLLISSPAWAQENNTITKKEAREGWLSLFDSESTYGWRSPNFSKWSIYQGMLAPQKGKEGQLITTTQFKNYELSMEYKRRASSSMQVIALADSEGKPVHERLIVKPTDYLSGWVRMTLTVRDGFVEGETYTQVGGLNGIATGRKEPFPPKPQSAVGHLMLKGNGFIVRNIKIKPLGTKSIFNGKDLTGWKIYKGNPGREKSKFTVEEGILRVKNGPGDLQTTEQYDNFVLQLECKTNGKLLNSGIFFRCLPDQYQQGYEAQIQNGFFEDKTKSYLVKVYDPKTHKLKDEFKVDSKAMDYGTGGIYRRSLARKKAANDNEWFTMTVLAHGRHLATWVNGVQVTDWTDNRPMNENARQGCRLKKGVISIQGHDPTTDLSFRNFRIGELSADGKIEN